MTRAFQTNADNDIFTTPGGQIAIAEGLTAVLQHCEHAIQAQTAEMIYAHDRGVNTFTSVWDGSPNLLAFEASARAQLERITDVVAVENFEAQLNGHTIAYQATIRTVFGTGRASSNTGGVVSG